MYTRIVPIIN